MDPSRYASINLTNLGGKKKNTIEFRLSNGTIDPKVIKENVFLYASIIDTAVKMTKEPEKMQEALKNFYKRDVTEEEKLDAFLGLIMEEPADRQVYKDRWQSVKDDPVFSNSEASRKFAKTFQREDYKKVADKTPLSKAKDTFNRIKDKLTSRKKEDLALEQ